MEGDTGGCTLWPEPGRSEFCQASAAGSGRRPGSAGGVADAGEILFAPIRETIQKRAMTIQKNAVEIVPAKLGNTAGVIGASLLINS